MKKALLFSTLFACVLTASNTAPKAYEACVACHGEKGELHALGKSKIIKNMSKADIVEAINIYKYGVLGESMSPLMKTEVGKLSDKQIKAIADYIGK